MDRITLRLEAARIAAQLTGVSTKNFIPVARRVERYIEGTAKLEEHFSEEDTVRRTVHEAMLEMTGAKDVIRKFDEMDKRFHEKHGDFAPTQDYTERTDEQPPAECKEDLYVFSNGLAMRRPRNGPLDSFPRPQPLTQCDEWKDTFRWMPQYSAPGGIPSSEAESIFLQADGEKVE